MGIVEATGPGAEALLGRRVVSTTRMAIGGYAEYVIGSAAAAFDVPESIGLPDAACLFSRSTSRGWACSTAPTCNRVRAC